jgi:lysophospholipase L1-like esterase
MIAGDLPDIKCGPEIQRSIMEKIIVAALGDSITAGTPIWDPDPAVRREIGANLDERSQWPYWAALADPSLEFRNHGVNRERTDQIRARLTSAAQGADVMVIQGGINDVVQGRAQNLTVGDLRAMVREARGLGLRVAVTDVLPWNNGYPTKDETIRELNAAIAEMAREESVKLLQFFATLEDPERPGRMREDWTSDGNHPTLAGHRQLATAFGLP